MYRIISQSYEEMSMEAARAVVDSMQSAGNKLLCLASGDTPAGLYRHLLQLVRTGKLDVQDWYFVGLDEWVGMHEKDEGSCRWHLDRQFFQPLGIAENRICFFNGRAANLQQECRRTEDFIRNHGRISAAVIGLGGNGHIGMNEPGTPLHMRTHVSDIDPETQRVGQKYFTRPVQLEKGITLGPANLLEAGEVMLLVSGAHKAGIVKRIVQEPISAGLPATYLRNHPRCRLFLDAAAAQMIEE